MAKDSGLNGYRNGAIFGFGIPKSTVLFGFQKWCSLEGIGFLYFFLFLLVLIFFSRYTFSFLLLPYQIDL